MSAVDRYLSELAAALPRFAWRSDRLLEEVDAHLRDSAARVGEDEAVRRFGPPAAVASAYRRSHAAIVAAAAVVAVAGLPILGYPLVENSLPPAPWPADAVPPHLHWKEDRTAQLFVLGAGAAAAGAALVTRRRPLALLLLGAAAAALAAMGALGIVLTLQWAEAVPGTPRWHTGLAAVFLAAALTAGMAVLRAARLRVASLVSDRDDRPHRADRSQRG